MKTLLSFPLLAVAGAALAQPSVTVYGVIDANVQALDGASRLGRVQSGGLNGSRLGFRGEEDLGGGLRAYFVLESGFSVDDGTIGQGGSFYGRQAVLGLRGRFGELSLGRQYGSIFAARSELSVFSDISVGPGLGLIGGFGNGYEPVRGASGTAVPPAAGATGNGGPVRVNNAVRFQTPSWEGLSATLLYGAGEVAGSTDDSRLVDVSLRYRGHGVDALLSRVDDKARNGVTGAQITTLAAAYRLDAWRVVGGWLDFKDRTATAQDGRGWWLGADYRFGSNTLKLQTVANRPKFGDDNESRALGLGWVYALSSRSSLYTSLTRFENDSRAGVGGLGRIGDTLPGGLTRPGDADVSELVMGIRHSF